MERQFCINWPGLVEEAKLRRKAQKLTQAQLAKLAGVSTPTISRFESGQIDIQLPTVLSVFEVLGMLDKRSLNFSDPMAYYDPSHMVVRFAGNDDGKQVKCAISREALEDHFGLTSQDVVKVSSKHLERIQHEVRRKYLSGSFEQDGSVLVSSDDLT